jgi:hypothetical protein
MFNPCLKKGDCLPVSFIDWERGPSRSLVASQEILILISQVGQRTLSSIQQ